MRLYPARITTGMTGPDEHHPLARHAGGLRPNQRPRLGALGGGLGSDYEALGRCVRVLFELKLGVGCETHSKLGCRFTRRESVQCTPSVFGKRSWVSKHSSWGIERVAKH